MPKSNRHHHAARKAAAEAGPPPKVAYKITDENHTPDLKGEFAGSKVRRHHEGHQVVHLTDRQAKFYIDNGAIEPLEVPVEPEK
jgi:hypothetical protein